MVGLAGGDVYVVAEARDVVDERGGSGIDTVEAWISPGCAVAAGEGGKSMRVSP
jgi:hypothetical protein